jgi:lactate dehydrogenase-like 2-hydroxyacid dehydrogenase
MEKVINIYFLDKFKQKNELFSDYFPSSNFINFNNLDQLELIHRLKNAQILCIPFNFKLSAKIIKALKDLKLIITLSAGYNHIDLKIAKQQGIIVANIPDYGSHLIAEFVFALLLSGLRYVREGDTRVEKTYNFSPLGLKGLSLQNKTIGIIGTGRIGLHVARIASLGFLMNTLAYDPVKNQKKAKEYNFKYTSLADIWQNSDIISLHCPLLKTTKNLINKKTLKKMKPGVVLVNTSRGALINSLDLHTYLKNKSVSFAFLDVLEDEDNIKKYKKIIDLPNVISTPHIAGYADDAKERQTKIAIETINQYLKGEKIVNQIIF